MISYDLISTLLLCNGQILVETHSAVSLMNLIYIAKKILLSYCYYDIIRFLTMILNYGLVQVLNRQNEINKFKRAPNG